MVSNEFQARLDEAAEDRISGAREILGRLLHGLRAAVGEQGDDAVALEHCLALAATVLPQQPSMAPLLTALDGLFRAHEAKGAQGVRQEIERQLAARRRGLEEVGECARARLSEVTSLATLSWSSTVAGVLASLGRPLTVLVAESRPGAEGRRAAARFAAAGHRVRFVCDASFPSAVPSCQALLLGADALTPDGLVNKVGSLAAAREAKMADLPVYATLEADKIVGAELAARLRIREEPRDTVWADAPAPVEVESSLFELVPLDLVTEILGPEGPRTAQDALRATEVLAPSPLWAQVPLPTTGRPLVG